MSNLSHFKRLGIDPTQDVKVIKRAYALVLRTIDQQHEREAFEQLRRDYEQSIAWARSRQEKEGEYDPDREAGDRQGEDTALDTGRQDRLDHDNGDDHNDIPPAGAPDVPSFGGPVPDLAHAPSGDPSALETVAIPPVVTAAPDPVALEATTVPPVVTLAPDPEPPRETRLPPPYTHTARHGDADGAAGGAAGTRLMASRQAINEWIARLFESRANAISDLLDAALRDERLAHLDSQSQLEAQLADALYKDSDGRAALFDAASQRFGWTSRHVTSIRDVAVAAWVSKVINQDLQWHTQQSASRLAQDAALKAAMATASPSNAAAYKFMPVLDQIHDAVPQWLALRITARRLREWHNAHSAISKNWLRWNAVKQHFAPKPRKAFRLTRKAVLTVLVSFGVVGLILSATEGTPPGTQAASNTQTQTADQNAAAAKAPEGPVLAYEFTGAVTKDSCEDTHEFAHESNWLEVKDASANALLTTRVLLCQDQKLWPSANDPLVTCLRAERLAALGAGRPEDNRHCQPPDVAKK